MRKYCIGVNDEENGEYRIEELPKWLLFLIEKTTGVYIREELNQKNEVSISFVSSKELKLAEIRGEEYGRNR